MRTDLHSESNLHPEEYRMLGEIVPPPMTVFGDFQFKSLLQQWRAQFEAMSDDYYRHGANIHPGLFRCDHCGAAYKWGVLMHHVPSGEYVSIGHQCAQERFSLTNSQWLRKKIEKARTIVNKERMRRAYIFKFARENREVFHTLNKFRRNNDFIASIRQQLSAGHELSERQIAAVNKFSIRVAEYEKKRAKEEANAGDREPVVEGRRIEITGEVLSIKNVEGYYGWSTKMLVRDERGFKVWGTVPSAISPEKGDKVKFFGNIEKSDNDEYFGFFKRPTKSEIL